MHTCKIQVHILRTTVRAEAVCENKWIRWKYDKILNLWLFRSLLSSVLVMSGGWVWHCACVFFFFFYFCLFAVPICPWLLPPSLSQGPRSQRPDSQVWCPNTLEWSGFLVTVSLWRIGHLGSSLLEIWMLVSKPASLNVFSLIPSLLSQPLCFLLPRFWRGHLEKQASFTYGSWIDYSSLIRWDSENQGVI